MEDTLARYRHPVQEALPRLLSIYGSEMQRRRSRGEQRASAYALDFDVIYDFVNPRKERPFVRGDGLLGYLSVEALKQRPSVGITLLPGAFEELMRYMGVCSRSAAPETTASDLLDRLKKSDRNVGRNRDEVIQTLQSRWADLVDAQTQMDRLTEFLSFPSLCGVTSSHPPNPEIATTMAEVLQIMENFSERRHKSCDGI